MVSKTIRLLFGRQGMELSVPQHAATLVAQHAVALAEPREALRRSLRHPIDSASLVELLARKNPGTVAITISDITRPVPNTIILPALLEALGAHGISDDRVTIIVGTGMHRASTDAERLELVGPEILRRCRVLDHRADDPAGLVRIADDPPVSVNKIFAEADFRIVTGLIEPHFMAGFSGGRKGLCPALVDLKTVQRFHGYATMGHANSANGILEGNPCHAESLRIARLIGVDFLVNVAINGQRQITGVYAGDMEQAHAAGVADVQRHTGCRVEKPFDLVVTCGGGYPLDQTFYQTVKGIVTALPACHAGSTLLIVSDCREGIGSASYADILLKWGGPPARWREFLQYIQTAPVQKDQWQSQLHTRALELLGQDRLLLASDGLPREIQSKLWITPTPGEGTAQHRAQVLIDHYLQQNPTATVAIIPEGPYTLLHR